MSPAMETGTKTNPSHIVPLATPPVRVFAAPPNLIRSLPFFFKRDPGTREGAVSLVTAWERTTTCLILSTNRHPRQKTGQ
ncbi:hypothetical protein VTK73DRAFT_6465 [Phialemonium thermophilum]|uniref:Uncharacterized protein n=1 Tax=Phialemonium thermophilum TaxID=223376 RepID=A0ABR3UZF4_9PEZI